MPEDEQLRPEPLVGEVVAPARDYGAARSVFTHPPSVQRVVRHRSVARLLVAVNIVVFLAMVANHVSIMMPSNQALFRWGALWGPAVAQGQYWRVITANFVHIGIIHIAFNMWCLWYLAELAENIFGGWTTAAIYLLTGISSSLLSLVWMPTSLSAGASGAIFGIAGAIITALRLGQHRIPEPVRRAISNSAIKFAVYNLAFGLFVGSFAGLIDNAAHIGGLFGGLLLGAAFAATSSMPSQGNRLWVRATICVIFAIILRIALTAVVHMRRWPL